MVNVSDVYAMGASIAVVDLYGASPPAAEPIWDGMKAAARAYNVPIVGGHEIAIVLTTF
jgi:selenophosphate synthetase-related protein